MALQFNLVNQMLSVQSLCQHEVLPFLEVSAVYYVLPPEIFFTDAAPTSVNLGGGLVS